MSHQGTDPVGIAPNPCPCRIPQWPQGVSWPWQVCRGRLVFCRILQWISDIGFQLGPLNPDEGSTDWQFCAFELSIWLNWLWLWLVLAHTVLNHGLPSEFSRFLKRLAFYRGMQRFKGLGTWPAKSVFTADRGRSETYAAIRISWVLMLYIKGRAPDIGCDGELQAWCLWHIMGFVKMWGPGRRKPLCVRVSTTICIHHTKSNTNDRKGRKSTGSEFQTTGDVSVDPQSYDPQKDPSNTVPAPDSLGITFIQPYTNA